MKNDKIKHPFTTPDNFFEENQRDILGQITNARVSPSSAKRIFLQVAKYAAIVVISFFIGRESMGLFSESEQEVLQTESYSIEDLMMHISEDDITEFIVEDKTIEI